VIHATWQGEYGRGIALHGMAGFGKDKKMAERVVVTISPTGKVQVEADGVIGSGCEALTQAMRDGLGETVEEQKKPEYYSQQAVALAEAQG